MRIIVVFCLIISSRGATFYVATNGNDSADGSISTPWLTIRHGAITMNGGDTLNIRMGTYPDDGLDLEEIKSGTPAQPTTVQAYNGEKVIYFPNAPAGQNAHGILLSGKTNVVLNGFELNAVNCTSDGIKLDQGTTNVVVTNMFIHGCGHGMGLLATGVNEGDYMGALITHCTFQTNGWDSSTNDVPLHNIYIQTSGMTVENCLIQGCTNVGGGPSGIQYFGTGATNGTFRNNWITNCSTGMIIQATGGSNCWIYNNVIISGYSYGISVGGMSYVYVLNNTCYTNNAQVNISNSTNVWIENNILVGGYANNPGGLYVTANSTTVYVRNNLGYGSTLTGSRTYDFRTNTANNVTISGNLFGVTQTTTNDVYDAHFANAANGDFHLTAGSDAIGAGLNEASLFTTDYAGNRRVGWDIGAYTVSRPQATATTLHVGTLRSP